MHKFCGHKDPQSSEFMAKSVKDLFDKAYGGMGRESDTIPEGTKFDVPFIIDSNGKTPIQLALGISDGNQKSESGDDNMKDLEMASMYLTNIRDASFLNQGQMAAKSIIQCLEDGVPGIGEFLDSRLILLPSLPRAIQNELKSEFSREINDNRYGVIPTSPWINRKELADMMYSESGWNQRYDNFIFDIPYIHERTPEGK